MSSLALQLQKLAVPHTQSILGEDKRRVSFLFDPKEAANLDKETVYGIGLNGLEELENLDPTFHEFEATLFSETSQGFERTTQTKGVNQKLNDTISQFLVKLSPFFLLKPAHKAIEWLVYRYRIHFHNIDDLLMCILPYHETKTFVRAVQMLKLDDQTGRWHWLEPIQKPGVPLARSTVMTHCYKDPAFLNFICDMVHKFIKVHGATSSATSPLRVLFSFVATTVIGALHQGGVKDSLIAQLLPFIVTGLKSKCTDFKVSVYMILSQLSSKDRIKSAFFESLLPIMTKNIPANLVKEGVTSLLVIYQYQNLTKIPKKSFRHLCELPGIVETLAKLSEEYLITPFLEPFLTLLITRSLSEAEGENISHKEILDNLLMACAIDDKLKKMIARQLLEKYLSFKSGEVGDVEGKPFMLRLKHFVGLAEKRYPVAVDTVIEEKMKEIEKEGDEDEKKLLQEFVTMTVSTAKHSILPDSQMSLMLGLNHPKSEIRLLAVSQLQKLRQEAEESDDDDYVKESLLSRLQDDDYKVVEKVLEMGQDLLKIIGSKELFEAFVKIMKHRFGRKDWMKVIGQCIDHMTSLSDDDLRPQITTLLLPYMMMTMINQADFVERIMESKLVKESKILKPAAKEWLKISLRREAVSDCLGQKNMAILGSVAVALSGNEEQSQVLMKLLLTECQSPGLQQPTYVFITLTLLWKMVEASSCPVKRLEHASTLLQLVKDNKQLFKSEDKEPDIQNEMIRFSKSLRCILEWGWIPVLMLKTILEETLSHVDLPSPLAKKNWWELIQEEGEVSAFLKFAINYFDFLTCAVEGKHTNLIQVYRGLLEHFIKRYFEKKVTLLKFLSIPMTSSMILEQDFPLPISVVLQAKALHVAAVCLKTLENQDIQERLSLESIAFPSLLIPLSSPHQAIRSAACTCLRVLQENNAHLSTPVTGLVGNLVKRTEELEADSTYLPHAMNIFLSKAFKVPKAEKLTPKRFKKKELLHGQAQDFLELFVKMARATECPPHVQEGLLMSLTQVTSASLLENMLPLLERLLESLSKPGGLSQSQTRCAHYLVQRYTENCAALLESNPNVLSAFNRCLECATGHHVEYMSIQGVALKQITREFFSALPNRDRQQDLFSLLLDLWVDTTDAKTANSISRVLKGLPLDAEQIITELVKLKKTTKAATVREVKRIKRSSKSDIEPVMSGVDTRPWRRVTLTLEMLQAKKKVNDAVKMVPVIFDTMRRCLELDDHQATEYLKQLLLSSALKICQQVEDDEAIVSDLRSSDWFKVDMIVQCIRTSDNPQTHHHALFLLTTAARLFPDLVLHNIMSVFTFMGANIMRQDDSYSFQVISKTVETVIPALIMAHESVEDKAKFESVVASVIQVFVDAYPHVPEHRRLPIFSKLVLTLGGAKFLWTTLVLLLDSYVLMEASKTSEEQESKGTNFVHPMVTFCLDLCNQFEPHIQVITAKLFMQYLVKLPDKEKDAPVKTREVTRRVKVKEGEESHHLISLEQHTAKQVRYFRYTVTGFIVLLLSDKRFIGKVVGLDDHASSAMIPHYQLLLEENLRYINRIAKRSGEDNEQNVAKFWRVLLQKAYDILDKVNSLLPSNVFVNVVSGLMKNELPIVRRKAMELLNSKLQQYKDKIEAEEVPLFLGLVAPLQSVVMAAKPGSDTDEEFAINKQTALFSLKVLCRIFGMSHPQTFKPILPVVTELFANPTTHPQVIASCLLCLAELCANIRAHAIPSLPVFMPKIINVLQNDAKLMSNDLLLLSSVTVVHKVVENLPNFLSPYLQDILTKVVVLSADQPVDEKSQLYIRLKSVRNNVATKLPSRVLLPTVTSCYKVLSTKNKLCIGPLMSILTDHITDMSRDNLNSHHNQILTFFFEALDYRLEHPNLDLSSVGEMEGHVIKAVLSMVMRLSEATFRPMFFKLFDWATRSTEEKERLLVFYRLTDGIADKLKTLFTLFAGHIVKNAANLMDENNWCKIEQGTFGGSPDGVTKSCQLLKYIFGVLHKCFLYDNEGFVNQERFDTLVTPLVDQIENQLGSEEEYEERMSQHLVPCLAQFAVASGDDSTWKPLNYQICLKTRHSSPKVRFAALKMIEELSRKLGEDYMILLPETIQFLAELLEDESFEVEQQCQEVISHMEKVLGEPLQKYF